MTTPAIAQSGHVLEQWFYGDDGSGGISPLRAALGVRRAPAELRGLLVLADGALVDKLAEVGVTGATAAALTLVPVLHVAWADGKVQQRERDAVLGGGGECGIVAPECKQLLSHWLTHRPQPGLFQAWTAYARALSASLLPGEIDGLAAELVELARSVAKAAGGILGIGRVSGAETKALAQVEAAFTG